MPVKVEAFRSKNPTRLSTPPSGFEAALLFFNPCTRRYVSPSLCVRPLGLLSLLFLLAREAKVAGSPALRCFSMVWAVLEAPRGFVDRAGFRPLPSLLSFGMLGLGFLPAESISRSPSLSVLVGPARFFDMPPRLLALVLSEVDLVSLPAEAAPRLEPRGAILRA